MTSLALGNAAIFFLLGSLHFYWAVGGKWAIDEVVPTKLTGEKVLTTSVLSCVLVGGGLWVMSFVHLANAKLVLVSTTSPQLKYATLAMGIIFLTRFVGDFKWIGLFKKVRDTPFGKNDTRYYVPLCLFLSVSAFLLATRTA
jgi:hypothetical protein